MKEIKLKKRKELQTNKQGRGSVAVNKSKKNLQELLLGWLVVYVKPSTKATKQPAL